MSDKLKFFGIYQNCYDYNNLTDTEQKEILIKNDIYVEGISNQPYDKSLVDPFYINRNQNIQFLGNDFKLNNKNYTLNPKFIDEVYNEITKKFENDRLINIDEYINSLTLRYNFIENQEEKNVFLIEKKKLASQDYSEKLSNKIFQDFHNSKNDKSDLKEVIIKKHLKYDIPHLSDYIFGLDNLQNFLSISIYFTFLRTTKIIDFCDENFLVKEKDIDLKKPSLPKAIAMLNEIGFFELEKLKSLTENNIAKIISIIQLKNPNDKNNLRSISGNIRVLNPDNKESISKYTSYKWNDEMKDLLNKIKKGDE